LIHLNRRAPGHATVGEMYLEAYGKTFYIHFAVVIPWWISYNNVW